MHIGPSDLFTNSSELSEEEAAIINACISIETFPKGAVLLKEGQVCRTGYFIIEGLVRAYRLIDGDERTTDFYEEGSAVISLQSYLNGTPADHRLECLEDTTLTVLTKENETELLRRYPPFADLCRMGIEQEFGAAQQRAASYMTSTAEERYLQLLDERPGLVQRVPQYQLASYLGIKPESLSRIRRRLAKRV